MKIILPTSFFCLMLFRFHFSDAQTIQTNPLPVVVPPDNTISDPTEMIMMKHNQMLLDYVSASNQQTIGLLNASSNTLVPLRDFSVSNLKMKPVALSDQRAVFMGYTASTGIELWSTDKTSSGTILIKDINPGGNNSQIQFGAVLNHKIFFLAKKAGNSIQQNPFSLWITDGTAAGTLKLADYVNFGTDHPYYGFVYTVFNGSFYFYAHVSSGLTELWKSDGTVAGTLKVLTLNTFTPQAGDFVTINDTLYFHGYDSDHGEELWRTEGTSNSMLMVKDLNPGSGSSFPAHLTVYQGKVWFVASNGTSYKLWYSNGTAAGTDALSINLTAEDYIWGATSSILYFTIDEKAWLTDGTDNGSSQLIIDGGPVNKPYGFFEFNGNAYFVIAQYTFDFAKNDGTPSGTSYVYGGFSALGATEIKHFQYNNKLVYTGGELDAFGETDGTIEKDYSSIYKYTTLLAQDDNIVYISVYTDSLSYALWKIDMTQTITSNEVCNGIDDNTNGIIDDVANISNATGTVSICNNWHITLLATYAETATFQWLKNELPLAGATSYQYTATDKGNYAVIVQAGTCIDTSAIVNIKLLPVPHATVTPLGNLDICTTGSVVLQANAGAGLSYQWYKSPGSPISSATNQTYTATTETMYWVEVTGANGCNKSSKKKEVYSSCKQSDFTFKAASEISLYPNPASSDLFINVTDEELAEAEVVVYDVSGRKLLTQKISAESNSLDVSSLENGIYLLEIKNGAVSIVKKFEINR